MRTQNIVELVKNHTRPRAHGPALKVQMGYLADITGAINHQAIANRSADQARAGSARDDGYSGLPSRRDQLARFLGIFWKCNGYRLDLINGGVRRIQLARQIVECDFAPDTGEGCFLLGGDHRAGFTLPAVGRIDNAELNPDTAARMNRIVECFDRLKGLGQKGFIAYIGAGDPNLEATRELALAFDQIQVDVLELGVPFSDPLADGLVNQLAAQRGLESGTTPPKVLETVATIRKESEIPIVLYIYFNLVHRCGVEKFIREASAAGVDGLLVLDLPPEEAEDYEALMRQSGLCNIYLVAPTTPEDRVELIVKRASGFVYYVSREGVTGMQSAVATTIADMTAKIRKYTSLPIAVGFGISTPQQARLVSQSAEAVVVGSAIVDQIAQNGNSKELLPKTTQFVQSLVQAVKSS